jgi:hypothetical protein
MSNDGKPRTKRSRGIAKDHLKKAKMSEDRKKYVVEFIDDVHNRLETVENEYAQLKKEMAIGEVRMREDPKFALVMRKTNSINFQIALRFKEKIMNTLGNDTRLFWDNGISNLRQVQELLVGHRKLQDNLPVEQEEPKEIAQVRQKWEELSTEIETIRARFDYGPGNRFLSLNNLHMLVKNVKNRRYTLAHTGLTDLDADALREMAKEMLSEPEFKEFSFVLALNEWISKKREESIWD